MRSLPKFLLLLVVGPSLLTVRLVLRHGGLLTELTSPRRAEDAEGARLAPSTPKENMAAARSYGDWKGTGVDNGDGGSGYAAAAAAPDCSIDGATAHRQQPLTPKIAFLFPVADAVLPEKVWGVLLGLDSDGRSPTHAQSPSIVPVQEDEYSLHVHIDASCERRQMNKADPTLRRPCRISPNSIFYDREVTDSNGSIVRLETPRWSCNLALAMRLLLERAMSDPAVTRFVFVSSSSVPLYPHRTLRRAILDSRTTGVHVAGRLDGVRYRRTSADFRSRIEERYFARGNQWGIYTREAACHVHRDVYVRDAFVGECQRAATTRQKRMNRGNKKQGQSHSIVPDAYYFATVLMMAGYHDDRNRTDDDTAGSVDCGGAGTHWQIFTGADGHTTTWAGENAITDGHVELARRQSCAMARRARSRSIGGGSSGGEGGGVGGANNNDRKCYMFLRKVPPGGEDEAAYARRIKAWRRSGTEDTQAGGGNDATEDEESTFCSMSPGLEFLHIPKTAGTAIEVAAAAVGISWGVCHFTAKFVRCPLDPDRRAWPEPRWGKIPEAPYWHRPVQYLENPNGEEGEGEGVVGISPYEGARLFAVVRDPYDRVISDYYWRLQSCIKKRGASGGCSAAADASAMNAWIRNEVGPLINASRNSMTYYRNGGHFVPQFDYIFDERGHRIVHHVLRFESLQEDFTRLMNSYNLSHVRLPSRNVQKGVKGERRLNASHLTADTLRVLNTVYARDFRLLAGRYEMLSEGTTGPGLTEPSGSAGTGHNDMLFLHMGKNGGGTIEYQFRLVGVSMKVCHPRPCPDKAAKARTILLPIRDPVDRFLSAFNWRALLLCRPENDKRVKVGRGRMPWNDPDHFCLKGAAESFLINEKYRANANTLAEALCDHDPGDVTAHEARKDLKKIQHLTHPLSKWVGGFSLTKIVAVVLEPGFDFDGQVREAIRWMLNETFGQSEVAVRIGNLNSSTPIANLHSSSARSNSPPLSDLGACCVARHYKKDFEHIQLLAGTACHGKLADACRGALQSILERRTLLLDENVPCQQLVHQ